MNLRLILLIALLFSSFLFAETVDSELKPSEHPLYGKVSEKEYLTGNFNPERHSDFITLKKIGVPTDGRTHYLRKEAAQALFQLYRAFKKDHGKLTFRVVSSTRNFNAQKKIWENKWHGRTMVDGENLPKTTPNPATRGAKILRYSSMPGTSRHHWGTDFDLNSLNNNYFKSKEGKTLFAWMKTHAVNYGFCNPYNAGRMKGYEAEKWHWSYQPLSSRYLKRWMELYERDDHFFFSNGNFSGSTNLAKTAGIYVNSVNTECK